MGDEHTDARADDGESESETLRLRSALHDVANALTVVLGWLEQAKEESLDRRNEALHVIDDSARRARQLARAALGGDGPKDSAPNARLMDVVAEVVRELMPEARRANRPVAAVATATERVPSSAELIQVLQNLVLNAIAFAPEGSFVRVAARATSELAEVDVTDEGPGVPVENRVRIFEGLSTRPGGAGVGLAGARALARSHGGDVLLLEGEGGAHFRVTWPTVRRPDAEALLAGRTALVVEDDPGVATLVELALSARGMTVVHATDALAVELERHAPHVILLDLSPVAADLPAAAALLAARRTVLMTGNADVQPAAFGPRTTLLRKPFETKELIEAVVDALT